MRCAVPFVLLANTAAAANPEAAPLGFFMRTENSNQISLFLTKVTASPSARPTAYKENVEGSGTGDGWSMTGIGGLEPVWCLPRNRWQNCPLAWSAFHPQTGISWSPLRGHFWQR